MVSRKLQTTDLRFKKETNDGVSSRINEDWEVQGRNSDKDKEEIIVYIQLYFTDVF